MSKTESNARAREGAGHQQAIGGTGLRFAVWVSHVATAHVAPTHGQTSRGGRAGVHLSVKSSATKDLHRIRGYFLRMVSGEALCH